MSNASKKDVTLSRAMNDIDSSQSWQGYTLDELRKRRMLALVKRELSRERIVMQYSQARGNVTSNGLRGMFFKNGTIGKLKTVDYLFLGWKLARGVIKLRNKFKR